MADRCGHRGFLDKTVAVEGEPCVRLVTRRDLDLMKWSAMFVNTWRGPVVVEIFSQCFQGTAASAWRRA